MDPFNVCRFGLLMDPLGKTGYVWFAMRTFTGLSQYPVFKVQAAADFPHILRFCPLLAAVCCFGGEEVHYAFASTVSTASQNFLPANSRPEFHRPTGETKNAPDRLGGRSQDSMSTAPSRASLLLCDRFRTAFRFQHALRSPVGSGGAATKITTRPRTTQEPFQRPL